MVIANDEIPDCKYNYIKCPETPPMNFFQVFELNYYRLILVLVKVRVIHMLFKKSRSWTMFIFVRDNRVGWVSPYLLYM